MSRIQGKLLLISLLVIFYAFRAHSQAKDNSPFSQFGIGDYLETDMPSSHAMGGLGATYHDFFEANLENPASLGFLQYTSLQLGFFAKRSAFKRVDVKQSVWSGNLDHLSLNIPIINPLNEALERRETDFSWGTSISLRPYSQVGYFIRLNENDPMDSVGAIQRTFTASGGLYQVNWGNGIKYKDFAAGINLTYLYGKQSFKEERIFKDLTNGYYDDFLSSDTYKGFQYRLGLLYEHPFDLKNARKNGDSPSRLLSAGFFLSGKSTLDTKSDESIFAINSVISDIDTVRLVEDVPGTTIIPGTWGAGLMYRHAGDFRVGLDYQGGSWSDFKSDAKPDTLRNTHRFAAGVAWIPDASSITSYFKRVEYRAGFYTLTDPRVIEGSQVKATAVTFGAGFPMILQRNIAWVQVGLDVGKRTGGDRLSENFVRGNIGIIFNDNSWFIKGKYN